MQNFIENQWQKFMDNEYATDRNSAIMGNKL